MIRISECVLERVEESGVDEQAAPVDPGAKRQGTVRVARKEIRNELDDRPDPERGEHQQIRRQEPVGAMALRIDVPSRSRSLGNPCGRLAASSGRARPAHGDQLAIGSPVTDAICFAASSSAALALAILAVQVVGLHLADDRCRASPKNGVPRFGPIFVSVPRMPTQTGWSPQIRQRRLHVGVLERGSSDGTRPRFFSIVTWPSSVPSAYSR